MLDILSPLLAKALIATIIASIVSASISPHIVLRGLSALGAALAHAALAGATLSLTLGINPTLGALVVSVIFAVLSGYGGERMGGRSDMVIGMIFGSSTAIAVLAVALSSPYISSAWRFLVGDVLGITDYELIELTSLGVATIIILIVFHGELKYTLFDPESAEAYGLNVRFYRYLVLLVASLCTVVNLRVVGSLLTELLIAAPAVIAYEFTHSFEKLRNQAIAIALLSSMAGFIVAIILNLPISGVVGVTMLLTYIAASILSVKRRRCGSRAHIRCVKEIFRE
ncbi:MAG: metal ABC transporter permease [Nitrososphaerota archaeon]|nr:metal ABC transporter permease [Candidatus Bathyarchaeota archaeon]MDW8061901.1 metal ABC transporter permease [Nitrososphaerota archaeon]